MGGGGAVVAIAASARRRRMMEIVDAFRLADATAPDRAQPVERLGLVPSREFDALAADGVLVAGRQPGSWYLSESGYVARRDARRARPVLLIGIALLLLALGAVLIGTG